MLAFALTSMFLLPIDGEASAPAPIRIAVSLEPGATVRLDVAHSMRSVATMGESLIETGVRYEQRLELSVESVDESGTMQGKLAIGPSRGVVKDMLGEEIPFDSEDEDARYPPFATMFVNQAKVQSSLELPMTLAPDGTITIHGYEERLEENEEHYDLVESLGFDTTGETFNQSTQLLLPRLSIEPVAVGGEWVHEIAMLIQRRQHVFPTTHALRKATPDEVEIDLSSVVEAPDSPPLPDPKSPPTVKDMLNAVRRLDAGLIGAATLSRVDGLPLRSMIERTFAFETPHPVTRQAMRNEVIERAEVTRVKEESSE